jgi:hypothetical protein
MASGPSRVRWLAVQIGDVHLFLSSTDVRMLADAINRLIDGMLRSRTGIAASPESAGSLHAYVAELQELRQVFLRTSGSLAGPPLKLDRGESRLLRMVLADITGYQRDDLTQSLRQVRQLLLAR